MAKLKDTNIDGALEVTGDVILGQKMAVHGISTNGDARENLQLCNQSNNCIVGYGNYAAEDGNTHIYGVAAKVITRDSDFNVDGIQLGHTEKTTVTSLSSGWSNYGNNAANAPQLRRYGKVVSLTGTLTNTAAVLLNTGHTKVFTIPSGYRPSQDVLVMCQGSNANEYVMQVKTNGDVFFGRYGTNGFVEAGANSWFPFHACWVMD